MTDDEYRALLQQAHDMEGHWPLNLARLAEKKGMILAAEIVANVAAHGGDLASAEMLIRAVNASIDRLSDAQSKDTEGA